METLMNYDSTEDTIKHIHLVQQYMSSLAEIIDTRSLCHDSSKLEEPEKSLYDEFTPKLFNLTYGSEEYKDCLKAMGPALQHHYEYNNHHPEHNDNGVSGMNLIDLLEMLADWKAATLRHKNGDILKSLEMNRTRFNLSDQLYNILLNTVRQLEWM